MYAIYLCIKSPNDSPDISEISQAKGERNQAELSIHEENVKSFNAMINQFKISEDMSPIRRQLGAAIDGEIVPEGGIFDAYIRGYILGFVDSYLIANGLGGIDANPVATTDAFSALAGDQVSNDDNGIQLLNECLKERHVAESNGSNTQYGLGFLSGSTDCNGGFSGHEPMRLYEYIRTTNFKKKA